MVSDLRSLQLRFLLVSLLVGTVTLGAQPSTPKVVAIVDTTVVPMTTNTALLRNHTVVVTGNRISALGPAASVAVPAEAQQIDGRGKFLMPGLADMHVHLEYFDDPAILGLFVANGVTTVRNMDGRPYILDWKRRIAAGDVLGPRIYTAGPLLDGNPPVRPDNTVVTSAADARAAVEAQAAAGYDFVKIYSALSPEAYQSIIKTAREKKLLVTGHVPRAVGVDAVLADGLGAIEHLADYASAIEADTSPFKEKGHWSKRYLSAPIDAARLRSLAERHAKAGVWSVPTLIQTSRELLRTEEIAARLALEELSYIPADGRRQWEQQSRRITTQIDDEEWKLMDTAATHRLQVVAAFRAAGVPMLIGTDTPNPFVVPGFALHDELALAVQAGLSPAEALAASIREAARFMGSADWGTVERGKTAELLLLDANPLDDIANTRRLDGLMLQGRWLSAADRLAMLARLRQPR